MTDPSASLEAYRQARHLTFGELALLIGVSSGSCARKYCLGIRRPEADEIERICGVLKGRVSAASFHQVRLDYLAAKRVAADAKEAA